MGRLKKIAIIFLLIIVGPIAAYWIAFPTYTYRYRMTVEVEVDGKVHSGSSVIEVRLQKQPQIFVPVPPVLPAVSGEAVFVDLGAGRSVIALLASGPNASNVDYPKYIVATHFRLSHSDRDLVQYSSLQGQWELPMQTLPTLVTFTDLNDPKTARVVRPEEFEAVFGRGVRFKRAFVEMTNDPVTRGIEKKMLEIIRQLREQAKSLQTRRPGDPYTARLGHFYIGN